MSIEEAKKLHEALNELFERKVIKVEERHIHHDYPWRWSYWQPTTITTTPISPNTIWYKADNGTTLNYDSNTGTLACSVS